MHMEPEEWAEAPASRVVCLPGALLPPAPFVFSGPRSGALPPPLGAGAQRSSGGHQVCGAIYCVPAGATSTLLIFLFSLGFAYVWQIFLPRAFRRAEYKCQV